MRRTEILAEHKIKLHNGKILHVVETKAPGGFFKIVVLNGDAFFAPPVVCEISPKGVNIPPGGSDAGVSLTRLNVSPIEKLTTYTVNEPHD